MIGWPLYLSAIPDLETPHKHKPNSTRLTVDVAEVPDGDVGGELGVLVPDLLHQALQPIAALGRGRRAARDGLQPEGEAVFVGGDRGGWVRDGVMGGWSEADGD